MNDDDRNVPIVALTTAPAARFPMPQYLDYDPGRWRVLTDAIFANARTIDSVLLALDYCRTRNLDPFKRPVNIVVVWNGALGREVETVWPSINEALVTASRSREWAGMELPVWGPERTETFKGRKKERGVWTDGEETVTFPEWGYIKIYRLVGGQPRPFVVQVHWKESYGRVGGSKLPNDMWSRRVYDQFGKVCLAASLRAAFPEEVAGPTAEEMDGADMTPMVDVTPAPRPADNWSPPSPAPTPTPPASPTATPTSPPSPAPEPAPTATPSAATSSSPAPTATSTPTPPPTPAPSTPPSPSPTPAATATSTPTPPPTPTPTSEPPPADPGDYGIDPETGEIPPQELPLGDQEEWRSWGGRFLSAIAPLRTTEAISAWVDANHAVLAQMEAHAPKIHVRLVAAITKRKIETTPVNPLQGG